MDEPHSHALAPDDIIAVKVKAELRKRMRGLRKTAPIEACNERSAKIIERVTPFLENAKSVALFWPIVARHEVDLRPLDAVLRKRGDVKIAYPAIDPETNVMVFRFANDTDLEEAGYGFAEPPATAPVADTLDVILVPALAVDPTGQRIGYGAGYYDRTLANHPTSKTIAVAFDYQLIAEVPKTEGDLAVKVVVTDTRTIEI